MSKSKCVGGPDALPPKEWCLVVILSVMGACAGLPDVKPFAAATLTLERTVAASFEASAGAQETMAALLQVPSTHPKSADLAPRQKQYAEAAVSIRSDGANRAILMRALSDYTDSLAAITDAAANAQANVDALANSVLSLVGSFSASPLPAVASGALDLGKLALREAINIKASSDLCAGLTSADPVVQAAAKLLLADVASLRLSVATKPLAANAAIQLAGGDLYTNQRRHLKRLESRRSAILATVDALASDVDIEGHTSAADLLKVEDQLAAARGAVAPIEARRDSALRDLAASETLFLKLDEAIAAWAKAHSDLAEAAQHGRSINLRRLVEVVIEAKGLVEKMEQRKELANGG